MIDFIQQFNPVTQAFIATLFTWGVTAAGAAMVFFSQKVNRKLMDANLGFAAGVMIAASFWSLLVPALDLSEELGFIPWLPAAVGFAAGWLVLMALDQVIPHLHIGLSVEQAEGIPTTLHQSTLLVLAITLHNIPEGLAIGVAFGAVAAGIPAATLAGAIALAVGIGIQNFPEGLAISMPLRREGMSRIRSFWYGQLSAVVEPVAAVLGALVVLTMRSLLPFALAFAAGAMVFVVIEEVIPESLHHGFEGTATGGFLAGFLIMMILDLGLG